MSNDLVANWKDRMGYAREMMRRGPLTPSPDHVTLLRASCWSWDECEFGAPSMDPKRPYGNSDVLDDLAELLPHLDEAERVRVHCELPAVLAWVTSRLRREESA